MSYRTLDLDALAEAGADSFALVRAMDENDAREKAAMQEAEALAEAEGLLKDAGFTLEWRPVQHVGRASVHTVRVSRPYGNGQPYAVYVGVGCSALRALHDVFDQGAA